MKPHEETWVRSGAEIDTTPGCDAVADFANGFGGPRPGDIPRAQLAAQAPAMARMLLSLQWSAGDNGCECPSCGEIIGSKDTHDPDCALVAVLRAAGVIK